MRQIFFILLLLLLSTETAAIPLSGVSLRIVSPRGEAVMSPRLVEVAKTTRGVRVKWFTLGREEVAGTDFPTFKVRANQGVLDVESLSGRVRFFHPYLWASGYMSLSESLPLWIAPEYLGLSGKKGRPFDLGFLDISPDQLKGAPDKFYEQILYFQNLYRYYFSGDGLNRETRIAREDQKELKTFIKNFPRVNLLAQTKAKLAVNKQIRDFDAKFIGNEYYQMIVLDDPENPLVISLKFFPERAPRVFQANFAFFKKHFEYQVTQINQ